MSYKEKVTEYFEKLRVEKGLKCVRFVLNPSLRTPPEEEALCKEIWEALHAPSVNKEDCIVV